MKSVVHELVIEPHFKKSEVSLSVCPGWHIRMKPWSAFFYLQLMLSLESGRNKLLIKPSLHGYPFCFFAWRPAEATTCNTHYFSRTTLKPWTDSLKSNLNSRSCWHIIMCVKGTGGKREWRSLIILTFSRRHKWMCINGALWRPLFYVWSRGFAGGLWIFNTPPHNQSATQLSKMLIWWLGRNKHA